MGIRNEGKTEWRPGETVQSNVCYINFFAKINFLWCGEQAKAAMIDIPPKLKKAIQIKDPSQKLKDYVVTQANKLRAVNLLN